MTISMNTTARESTREKNITRNDNINEHNCYGKYKSIEYNKKWQYQWTQQLGKVQEQGI